ncbi:MAG TPA: GNAT family N-acetyltransferase [Pyrinomonadaceae bacterium]|nr:GNAT family N-acetyltransferase [Pyrinomonadaceae bacterium]
MASMRQEVSAGFTKPGSNCGPRRAQPLADVEAPEVLDFLAARPLHTVFMASLIRDNGVVSNLNRGSFYGCRSNGGALEGVALLGHATLIETESTECIKAFAQLARTHSPGHLIRGEQQKIASFWKYYNGGEHKARLFCGELLLQLKEIPPQIAAVSGLRPATIADLEYIVNVNASMACDESGINPLARDPQGFRERAARRIAKGRIWVWFENQRLLYKTDVVAETPQAIYLEGVYVHPDHRFQGYGLRGISQLAAFLLERTETICLTVNEKATGTQRFYKRAGYELVCRYDSIYLDNSTPSSKPAV